MEFPPCEQLVEILSHSVSREEAIDQVCALSVEGCTSVAHTFEGQYTMIYAQHAHRVVCGTQPENDSCRRMQELALLVEPELVAPPQPTGGGPFCDDDPTSCLDLAGGLVKEGRYEHAAWLYYTWCKSHKSPLEDCGTWLQLARWRTYFSEAVKHLLETKALKASVDNPRTIRPLIEATCAKGDGMSCFFLAVLTEIAQPKDVEATRKVYKRACDLGYVRGCTNALSISSRHPGEGMPLPSDAEQRYSVLCFERNEAESCGQLAILSVQQFEWKGAHRQEVDRAGMRTLLEQTCQREVAARLGDKDACRQFNRLKRGSSLTG